MVTVFHYTPVNAKQFNGLNIDSLAGKSQNFPRQNFEILYYKSFEFYILLLHSCSMYSPTLTLQVQLSSGDEGPKRNFMQDLSKKCKSF